MKLSELLIYLEKLNMKTDPEVVFEYEDEAARLGALQLDVETCPYKFERGDLSRVPESTSTLSFHLMKANESKEVSQ